MKTAVILAFVLSVAASLSASAQPSSKPTARSKATALSGVEAIKPQEQPPKEDSGVNGWNGSYVGVNAGMGFGATAGTNLVVPFGTSSSSDK